MALLAVLIAPAWADEGDYQNFHNILPGFGSRTGKGQAGVTDFNRPATPRGRFGVDCPGYIDAADRLPEHRFWVFAEVDLILTVSSNDQSPRQQGLSVRRSPLRRYKTRQTPVWRK